MMLLYDIRIQRITREADAIWQMMAGCHSLSPRAMQLYNLRASAKNLRAVADKLDAIQDMHTPQRIAAE